MKIIDAKEVDGSVRIIVHMDESKKVSDEAGTLAPDPDFLMSLQWGADVPADTVKRETALLCEAELARRGGKKVAALNGATITSQKKK